MENRAGPAVSSRFGPAWLARGLGPAFMVTAVEQVRGIGAENRKTDRMLLVQPALTRLLIGAALTDMQHGVALGVLAVVVWLADRGAEPARHAPEWQLCGGAGGIAGSMWCGGWCPGRSLRLGGGGGRMCGRGFEQAGDDAHAARLGGVWQQRLAPSQSRPISQTRQVAGSRGGPEQPPAAIPRHHDPTSINRIMYIMEIRTPYMSMSIV